ncbi:MAG: D-2-hydroxyacid dehydrogenase [Pseudomonadales bacterium]|nr:D-2-hydroxyacid dehydrogenase [Pseudomonadales bacterium]
MNKLMILAENGAEIASLLQARGLPDLDILCATDGRQGESIIGDVDIALGTPALIAPLLPEARKLQWIQSGYAGVEPFCQPASRTDYVLTGVKDIFGGQISQYVFTYLLAIERNLLAQLELQYKQTWEPQTYRDLTTLTLGVCGLGSIGREVAETARHFGMRVVGLSYSATPVDGVDQVFGPDDIISFAEQCDFLVSVLPATPATQGKISAAVLNALGPKGLLINVGRGSTVDETALVHALQSGVIRGAVLDVFSTEPLPPEHPLWRLGNVLITPHNAAVTFPHDIVSLFAENYRRFQAGEALKYPVDFSKGY